MAERTLSRRLAWRLRYGLPLGLSLIALIPEVGTLLLFAGAIVAFAAARSTPNVNGERPAILDRVVAFRWFVAGCQAITIVITWTLWGARPTPPLLPAFGLPSPPLNLGILLLGTLALTLWRPKTGAWLHLLLLAAACMADQTRIQPEMISLAILLLATSLSGLGRTLGRAHIATLLLWSGVNKLLSLGFFSGTALYIYDGLPLHVAAVRPYAGWLIAGTEIAVGLGLALKPLRPLGVSLSLGLHAMILYVLSPLGHDYNQAVWAWNLALPVAAVIFFWPRPLPWLAEPVPAGAASPAHRLARPAILGVAALYPLGYFVGVVDAYMAHNLYSDSTAAEVCLPTPECGAPYGTVVLASLRVPLPPEPRLFTQYFDRTCRAGQELVLIPRNTRLLFGLNAEIRRHRCPRG